MNCNDNLKNSIFKIEKIQSLYNIFAFLDFFTLSSLYFVNSYMKNCIRKKYQKRITMILYSLKIYRKFININCRNDFKLLLMNNAEIISKFIKPLIINALTDYYYKLPVLKYYFSKMKKNRLEEINCKRTNLAKKSINYLSYYLEDNLIVRNLNLSKNNLLGEVLDPLVKVIKTALNLQILKLNSCNFDDSSLMSLGMILKLNSSISKLELRNCDLNDQMISRIKSSDNLRCLDLFDNKISSSGVIYICKNFKFLKEINFGKNNLDNKAAMFLYLYMKEKENILESLDLQQNYLSKEGMKLFMKNPTLALKELNLSYNFNSIFSLTDLLNCSVTKLKMSGYTINIEVAIKLYSASVTELDLSDSKFDYSLIDEYLRRIITSFSLDSLNLSNCYLNQSSFYVSLSKYLINKESKLSHLFLSNNFLYKINPLPVIEIIQIDKLISLDLSSNGLYLWADDFLKLFGLCLNDLKCLKKLNLNANNLSDKLLYLFNSSRNQSLEILLLDENKIDKFIFHSLLQNLKVSELSLKNNNFSDEVISILLEFLNIVENRNRSSMLINLNDNKFNYNGVKKIVDYFKHASSNIQLKLSSYNFLDSYLRQEGYDLIQVNNNLTGSIKNNIIL